MFVGAPGWHDDAIVTPLRRYGGKKRIVIDPTSGAHLASYTKGSGSLKGWQRTVGRLARQSTGLRLSIAAALAGALLRPLSMDSFALNLFAPTSTGKSSLLCAAASVPGLNNKDEGLPKWSDSEAAIEELAIGHRDGLLPLDESGDQDSKVEAHVKAKQLAFLFSRNRARILDKTYQKKINLTLREFRVIVLSTSEFALKAIAEAAGHARIGGEEVRFIDVPVVEPGSIGVFDGVMVPSGREAGEFGRMLADKLREEAMTNQGFVMDAFLRKFMRDPEAGLARAKHHMSEFNAKLSLTLESGPDQRICMNFSVMYAAAALGIEYGILPWKKKATRVAIEKCMARALATICNSQPTVHHAPAAATIKTAASRLRDALGRLNLIPVKKGKACSDSERLRRQQADGFHVAQKTLVKSKAWKASDTDKALLVKHHILQTQRNDVATLDRKIIGISGKRRYYVIDEEVLAAVMAASDD
jgi:putative DNA primase/helicase